MKIDDVNLKKISGGNWTTALIITAAAIFLIGVFDGYTRPLNCN